MWKTKPREKDVEEEVEEIDINCYHTVTHQCSNEDRINRISDTHARNRIEKKQDKYSQALLYHIISENFAAWTIAVGVMAIVVLKLITM